jgi:hypothetical protein
MVFSWLWKTTYSNVAVTNSLNLEDPPPLSRKKHEYTNRKEQQSGKIPSL